MSEVLPYLVIGIAGGASYALIALGLVLMNKASKFLSFAQGEVGTFAAMLAAVLVQDADLPWALVLPIAIVTGAAIAVIVRTLLLGRAPKGKLPPLVGTIAALLLLTVAEFRLFSTDGSAGRRFESPFTGGGVTVFDVVVSQTQIFVIVSVALVCVALWWLIERTTVGLMIRASADNATAARVVGLRPGRVEMITWALAGALAAIAGVFLGWIGQQVGPGFLIYALAGSFTAAILGGITSLPGAVLGGVVVGLAEALTRYWAGNTPGAPQLVVFVILFLTLLLRPRGLLRARGAGLATEGTESMVSLHALVTVPQPRRSMLEHARRRLPLVVVAAGATALIVPALADLDAFRLSLIPIMVMLALSLNMLITTTGQVSLAHVGLLGVGAFMTAIADTSWDLPFLAAVVVGTVCTGLVALLLGVAALRVRGLYLAVLTLSFAVLLEAYIFPRPEFSKGGAGLRIARPTLGPFDLENERVFLVAALLAMVLVWVVDRHLLGSPLGRAWIALRENEVAATAKGVRPSALRVAAFTISGLLAGLAGALFAYRIGHLVSQLFPLFLSFTVILYVVLGGIGSRVGVAIFTTLFSINTTYGGGGGGNDLAVLAGAAIVLLTIGLRPDGVAGIARDLAARWRGRGGRTRPPGGALERTDGDEVPGDHVVMQQAAP